jgi:quinohemoprotein amine dehydrogenase
MLHRASVLSLAAAVIGGTLLASLPQAAPAKSAVTTSKNGPEIFRTTCIGCHSVDKTGRIPRLDGVRTTPEEWDNILRRMGRRGYPLGDSERKAAVKEISRYQSLTPDENAAIGYLAVSPAASLAEPVPNQGDFRQTCVSCHSYAKIASHRRSPDSWAYLHDFHIASFTASLTQSYRDMHWPESAKQATSQLAKRLPFETAEWRAWKQVRQQLRANGTWIAVGHEPGVGDYEATMILTPKGDDEYGLKRYVRYSSGKQISFSGQATLFGGGALRAQWQQEGQLVKASWTIGLPDHGLRSDRIEMSGSWQMHRAAHRYGRETGSRLRTQAGLPTVLRLSPAWVRPGQGKVDVTVTTNGPAFAHWRPLPADQAVTVLARKQVDPTHVVFTLDIGAKARVGALALNLNAASREGQKFLKVDDRLMIAKAVDYIRVTPEKAVARLGGLAVPKDAVPFEAMGYSNGPDGKRFTDDDLALGYLPATWSVAEYFNDFEDDDANHAGTLSPQGLFMPADEGEAPKAYNLDNTGNLWVVATVARPGQEPLQARAYLNVSAPDIVKPIR